MTVKKPFNALGQVWLSRGGENVLNESRMALLEKIAETGSITKAGKAVGISYRTAWITVDHLNGLSDRPLVDRTTGGKNGGGTRLTRHGADLLKVYRVIQAEHGKYLEWLREGIHDFDRFLQLTRKISLKTSARNQLFGVVESIRRDALTAVVALRIKGKGRIISEITVEGLESLGLRKGEEAYAIIKSNWISPLPVRSAKSIGTENRLAGRIVSLKKAKAFAEVIMQLEGGSSLVSTLPPRLARDLKLETGMSAIAAFNASSVILGIAR